MIFLATCGRGMEKFVNEELDEIENVCKSMTLSEGKVIFCFCTGDEETDSSPFRDEICNFSISNQTFISKLENLNNYFQKYVISHDSFSIFKPVFNLKLVEKVYILLHLKTISNSQDCQTLAGSLYENICKINLTPAMELILNIKKVNTKSEWKKCSNSDQCYAYITRQKEKEKIKCKRKLVEKDFEEDTVNRKRRDKNEVCLSSLTAESLNNTLRVSCRIRGEWKKHITPNPFAKALSERIGEDKKWTSVNSNPDLDIYVNMNDECVIVGASLTDKPLSLRSYMSHITLRSTICHLIVKEAKIKQGFTVLDPMCGSGSILLEAAMCIKELRIIACDIDSNTLLSTKCNLRDIELTSIILSDMSSIPLLNDSVNAVVCDFPFGKKHVTPKPFQRLLVKMIQESIRVLRASSRLVMLVSTVQQEFLKNNINQVSGIKMVADHPVSLGLTPAYIMTFQVD